MNYGSLKCANKYAKQHRIEEWVHNYLQNDGHNKEFSDGLKLFDRYFIGPIIMPLKLFKRCCGPEECMKYHVDCSKFELRVTKLMDVIKADTDLPPLIIHYADNEFELSDGNHRFEAYSRLGIKECPVIIWITEKSDYEIFIKKFQIP